MDNSYSKRKQTCMSISERKAKVSSGLSINMPYGEPTSVVEITQSLERLQDQLHIIIESLGNNHIEENGILKDVRIAELVNCKSDISINIVLLNILVAKETGRMNEEQWLSMFGINPKDLPVSLIETRIRQYLKLSLTTMFQFRIENMITNILAIFDQEKAKKGYFRKVEALLDILELKDRERKLKILNLLQFIRNSLHSGGVNNRYVLDVTVDGCRFNFQKGKKVNCAGWGHITLAVESSMIIINEILRSQKVKAIPEPISVVYIEPDSETNMR